MSNHSMKSAFRTTLFATVLASVSVLVTGAQAQGMSDPLKNKRITIVVGTGAGGAYGVTAQLLARYWTGHVPGNPSVIVQAMPGAGGLKMAGYLHNVAPSDGTIVGMALQTVAMAQMLRPKAVKHDVRTWPWIGNAAVLRQSIVVSGQSPVRSFDDARTTEVVIGATSRTGNLFIVPKMAKELAGAKFKVVTGYRGGAGINKAIDAGEVQGRGGTWQTWTMRYPQRLTNKEIIPLVLTGTRPDPDYPNVPLLRDLVSDPLDKQVVDFFGNTDMMARPFTGVPRTPKAMVDMLRTSFKATLNDPKMQTDAAKRGIPVNGTAWQELEKAALGILDVDPKVLARMKAVLEQ